MMNIPASIEALIKKDTTRKNFRVQFPNDAARADLTNEDLVQESVKFTESICSQDSFRFGLAECSVIEFETVGVADMRGELIRCSCEIDTSDLTAAQLAEISAGSYDGELVLAAGSDLDFGFYRIPYGDFVVAECPRNHELIEHRQVTAYSAGYDFTLPEITAAAFKLPIPAAGITCQINAEALALACLAQGGDEAILQAGWTRGSMTPTLDTGTNPTAENPVTIQNRQGQTLRFWVSSCTSARFPRSGLLFALQLDAEALRTSLEALDSWLASKDPVGSATSFKPGTQDTESTVIENIEDLRALIESRGQYGDGLSITPHWRTVSPYYSSVAYVAGGPLLSSFQLFDSIGGFIPYAKPSFYFADGSSTGNAYTFQVIIPTAATIEVENLTTGERDSFSFAPAADYADYIKGYYYYYSSGAALSGAHLSFSANGDVPGVSSFDGAFSVTKILNDYLELRAQFAAPSRFGGLRYIQLDGGSPAAIAPEDYSAFWWDEYSNNVGTIRFLLSEEGQDTTVNYEFGPGAGVYDMSSNTILRDCGFALQDAIALFDSYLVPALQAVKLSSIELSAEGRPDLEPGDALQITDQAGQTIDVYLMRREMAGIQVLHDEITAVDGTEAGQGGQAYNSGNGQGVKATDDWVVEQGTSGSWVWKKWRSGFAECEGIFTDTGKTYSAWGSGFYTMLGARTLPSGLFYSVNDYIAAAVGGNDCWIGSPLRSDSDLTTTRVPPVMALRFTTASNTTVVASYRVIGRWKA